jgi:hypothetical protein
MAWTKWATVLENSQLQNYKTTNFEQAINKSKYLIT